MAISEEEFNKERKILKKVNKLLESTLNELGEDVSQGEEDLIEFKKNIKRCDVCGHLTNKDICNICSDEDRDQNTICVIEDFKSVFAFEKSRKYRGVYHVLNGLISPMDDIGAEDINLSSLVKRVQSLDNPELILALKGTIEGETTTLYIKKIFEEKNVIISRLSYGLPIGAEIDYLDMITIDKALSDRKKIFDGKES